MVRGGLVYDGSGRRPSFLDVAIKDGRVVSLEPGSAAKGRREIDARGEWVLPGFVDQHTHYDVELEVDPSLQESVKHGVTTVVIGNCSLGLSAGTEEEIADLFSRVEVVPRAVLDQWLVDRVSWTSVKGYFQHLQSRPKGPNVAAYMGHSSLRIGAMGLDRALKVALASESELETMESLLVDALDAGALGLSIDQLPWHRMDGRYRGMSVPSQQADPSEHARLLGPLRRRGRVLQATPSAVDRKSAARLLFWSIGAPWRDPLKVTLVSALDLRGDRRAHRLARLGASLVNRVGGNVRFQVLPVPFEVWGDGPVIPFFEELASGTELLTATGDERRTLLADTSFRRRLRADWDAEGPRVFHRDPYEMWLEHVPGRPDWAGKRLAECAAEIRRDPVDLFFDLLAEHDEAVRWRTVVGNDRDGIRHELVVDPNTLPGFSDAGAHLRQMAFYDSSLRLLREVFLDPSFMTVEAAVSRLTREPAEWLGLDAGRIDVGRFADLVLIDPRRLGHDSVATPTLDRHDRLGGVDRMTNPAHAAVRRVLIGGEVAYSCDGGFAPTFGRKPLGRFLAPN